VSLIISPWNYPFNLTVCPLISSIAAGNATILKPSESTPHTSALMREMVAELFAEDEVALFEGEADVAQELLAQPFDHVFFTGSPAIGKLVMRAASEHLTTVTLELGGKSPVLVDRTAHLDDAAQKTVWGKFLNQGQTCIAPDYILVDRSVHDDFVAALSRTIETYYGADADARRSSPDLARIVNERHHRRLVSLLEQSVEQGARIAFGGAHDAETRWVEPTLLVDVPLDSPAMQEEIFGPILPVVPVDDLDGAIEVIRARSKPLALYAFGNRRFTNAAIERTSAGGTCVNDVALHFLHANLPFGGVNHSGHGSCHGEWGFRAFSHERAVLKHHRWSALKFMAPPYSPNVQRLVDWTVKFL
ncbi:MAG: aldehyde dehydrogenase family protein, partial [Acidobacteriota bacterium]